MLASHGSPLEAMGRSLGQVASKSETDEQSLTDSSADGGRLPASAVLFAIAAGAVLGCTYLWAWMNQVFLEAPTALPVRCRRGASSRPRALRSLQTPPWCRGARRSHLDGLPRRRSHNHTSSLGNLSAELRLTYLDRH